MGLGGYLTWTAVARELKQRLPEDIKIIPIEAHGSFIKLIKSEIFWNNPNFIQNFSENNHLNFPIVLNNPDANYCKQDLPDRVKHRFDKHIIEQICEVYGIQNPKLKCEIFLSNSEEEVGRNLRNDIGPYIAIEPQSNDGYGVNKVFPFDKWKKISKDLSNSGLKLVQIGKKTQEKFLEYANTDFLGKTSFREAASIIKYSDLFVSSEGGLMHAANAVEKKSVIVYSGFIHPKMTGYPENINLWAGESHGPCGMKSKCEDCQKDMENYDYRNIISAVHHLMEK